MKKCQQFKDIYLKKHQKSISDFIVKPNIRGIIGFHSTGSGKSISALTVARCLGLKTIFVMPSAVISGIENEISKIPEFKEIKNIELLTYGTFINKFMDNPKMVGGKLVILDEVQNFRSGGNETYKMIFAISKAKKVLLLSATPLQNDPSDIVAALCMLNDVNIKNEQMAEIYYKQQLKIFNDADDNEISKILKNKISFFQSNKSIDPNYPNIIYKNIHVYMTPTYYKEYEKIENNEKKGLPFQFKNSKDLSAFFNGLRRASNHIYKLSPKIKQIVNLIENQVKKKRKVVVYSAFQNSGIQLIKNEMLKKKINTVTVSGSESATQKGESVNLFNNDLVNVMLITSAAAAGIDLKGTRDLIIIEPHWNSQLLKQVHGRVARYKSHTHLPTNKQSVKIYTFILRKPEHIIKNKKLMNIDKQSIDELILSYSKSKDKKINDFYKLLIQCSIEKQYK